MTNFPTTTHLRRSRNGKLVCSKIKKKFHPGWKFSFSIYFSFFLMLLYSNIVSIDIFFLTFNFYFQYTFYYILIHSNIIYIYISRIFYCRFFFNFLRSTSFSRVFFCFLFYFSAIATLLSLFFSSTIFYSRIFLISLYSTRFFVLFYLFFRNFFILFFVIYNSNKLLD